MKDVKRTANNTVRKASKSSIIVSNRIKRLKDFKFIVGELKEEISDKPYPQESLQIMSTLRLQIKRERNIGCQLGSLLWPFHIAMRICELLVDVPPSFDIPDNIQTISAALTGSEVN